MSVGYLRREPPATAEQIDELQRRIGAPLPADYRAYLTEQNGGRLENNNEAVKTVFGLGDELPDYTNMGDMLDTYRGRVPAWLLPVAQDEYGNLFTVSLRAEDEGAVWFWDHEEEADEGEPPAEDNLEPKAAGWTQFLDSLTPPPAN